MRALYRRAGAIRSGRALVEPDFSPFSVTPYWPDEGPSYDLYRSTYFFNSSFRAALSLLM
jgi:hypothetical protein